MKSDKKTIDYKYYLTVLELAKKNADCYEYCMQGLEKENEKLKKELEPFQDDYFRSLNTQHIAELAKKSIRLTEENREMVHLLELIYEKYNNIDKETRQKIEKYVII